MGIAAEYRYRVDSDTSLVLKESHRFRSFKSINHEFKDQTVQPHPNHASSPYRADIDGLRAIAVLAVVTYHAFPGLLRGGFAGVDIFFVISGYLITRIILNSQNQEGFNLLNFYLKRVKRIFPALFVVLTFTLLLGGIFFTAEEYRRLGLHIAAGAAYASNFLLLTEGGYFDVIAEQKPLLHLWSLAIEEQFYLFWPLILMAAHKFRVNALKVIATLLLLSFSLNILYIKKNPTEVFYLPLFRMWELLAGGILAYLSLQKASLSGTTFRDKWFQGFGFHAKYCAEFLSWSGLIFILIAIKYIKSDALFPGWLALIPVIGSSLIIFSGSKTWLNRNILSSQPLVLIGLISYPVYLWHWPLLSFGRIIAGEALSVEIKLTLVVSAFLLAWMTYRFIEHPIRLPKSIRYFDFHHIRMEKIPILLCSFVLTIGLSGYLVYREGGLPSRNPEVNIQATELSWDQYFEMISKKTFECSPENLNADAHRYNNNIVRCRQSLDIGSDHDTAIVGDSHAEHLFWGLAKETFGEKNIVYFTYSCFPFVGLTRINMQECQKMEKALGYILESTSIKTVVLSAFWYDRHIQEDFRLNSNPTITDRNKIFKSALSETLKRLELAGKNVIIALDGPTLNFDPARCLRPLARLKESCTFSRKSSLDRQEQYRNLVHEVVNLYPKVLVYDPIEQLCPNEICTVMMNGHFLYKDRHHLTTYASEYLATSLSKLIDRDQ